MSSDSSTAGESGIDVRRLYDADRSDAFSVVLGLLDEAISHATAALQQLAAGDVLTADDEFTATSPILTKLFYFRHLGEGFGNVVSALIEGLMNGKGQAPQRDQIFAIGQALRRLRDEPFLTFESSLEVIESLQKAGVQDMPSEIIELADALAESCPR
jgi:hypothetical protein